MYFDVRSDLACEMFEKNVKKPEGAEWKREQLHSGALTRLRIISEEAEHVYGKPRGTYVTVECGRINLMSEESFSEVTGVIARELRRMTGYLCGREADASFGVFVAGLGNAELTADAIGPKTVGRLMATRHLREHEGELYQQLGCSALSALAPGVLGQTGIETQELLRGVVQTVRPDLILVIDALAARSCARLASTVQLSDVGITPGSGVGNHRGEISRRTMGVPVIALGVPTVVNSATLVFDALREAGINEIGDGLREVLENRRGFFVSPKESDVITDVVSELLATSVKAAFTSSV